MRANYPRTIPIEITTSTKHDRGNIAPARDDAAAVNNLLVGQANAPSIIKHLIIVSGDINREQLFPSSNDDGATGCPMSNTSRSPLIIEFPLEQLLRLQADAHRRLMNLRTV